MIKYIFLLFGYFPGGMLGDAGITGGAWKSSCGPSRSCKHPCAGGKGSRIE